MPSITNSGIAEGKIHISMEINWPCNELEAMHRKYPNARI